MGVEAGAMDRGGTGESGRASSDRRLWSYLYGPLINTNPGPITFATQRINICFPLFAPPD